MSDMQSWLSAKPDGKADKDSLEEEEEEGATSTSHLPSTVVIILVAITCAFVTIGLVVVITIVIQRLRVSANSSNAPEEIQLQNLTANGGARETRTGDSPPQTGADSALAEDVILHGEVQEGLTENGIQDCFEMEPLQQNTDPVNRNRQLSHSESNSYRVENEESGDKTKNRPKNGKPTSSGNPCMTGKDLRRSRSKSGNSDSGEEERLLNNDAIMEHENEVFEESQEHPRLDSGTERRGPTLDHVYINDTLNESLPNIAVTSKEASVVGGNACTEPTSPRKPEIGDQMTLESQKRDPEDDRKMKEGRERAIELAKDKSICKDMSYEILHNIYTYFKTDPDRYRILASRVGMPTMEVMALSEPREVLLYMQTSMEGKRDIARLINELLGLPRYDIVDEVLCPWILKKYANETEDQEN